MRHTREVIIMGIILLLHSGISLGDEASSQSPDNEALYLSLNEVLSLAVANNFDIQLNMYDQLIKETDLNSAKSIYDTTLTLTGEYNYDRNEQASAIFGTSSHEGSAGAKIEKKLVTGTDLTVDFQNARSSSDSAFSTLNPSYESSLELKFVQPLLKNFFGMNDWGDIRITKIDVDNYKLETLDAIEDDLGQVEKAYWDVVASVELVKAREEMHKKAVEFYQINVKKKGLGTSELTDVLSAEANKELRKSELDVEKDDLKVAINNLKLLINHPQTDSEIMPMDGIALNGKAADFAESLKTAFTNRRDYLSAKDDIKAKKIKFNMKRNERWPELDFEGSLLLNGIERVYKDAAADAFTHENPEYTAKFTFTFPLENRQAWSAYNEAKYEKAKALVSLKKTERTIVTEIDDSVRRVNLNKETAMQKKTIEELQRKKLEEEERQFGFGRSDSDRIVRFQESLLQAKIQAVSAFRQYKKSLVDLYLTEDTFLEKRSLTVQ